MHFYGYQYILVCAPLEEIFSEWLVNEKNIHLRVVHFFYSELDIIFYNHSYYVSAELNDHNNKQLTPRLL